MWRKFSEICKIPRCSGNEEKIIDYVIKEAKKNNLEVRKDDAGNIVVRKKATINNNAPIVTLQAHLDMVCEKRIDADHDFSKDPIKPYVKENWVTAENTTLGADNGIGVAACLALMESKYIKHGPLEFLFTVSEETGLEGAQQLKKNFIKGKYLINLDANEFGTIYIGCAGGGISVIKLPLTYKKTNKDGLRIEIKALKGGHSGTDINKGRANAINLIARLLYNLNVSISKVEGGDKNNAIPRYALAEIATENKEGVIKKIKKFERIFKEEFKETEHRLKVEVRECEVNKVLEDMVNKKVKLLLMSLPYGVLEMSEKFSNLVKTSNNPGRLRMNDNELILEICSRSLEDSKLRELLQKIQSIAELVGASFEEKNFYSGWMTDTNSLIVKIAEKSFEELYNKKPCKKIIHAGLEAGIIAKLLGTNEAISIGPKIEQAHSPDERVEIESVKKFWNYLLLLLEKLGNL